MLKQRKFVDEYFNLIFDGNNELISFLQKAVGYAFTKDVKAQMLFIFTGIKGIGANSKDTDEDNKYIVGRSVSNR